MGGTRDGGTMAAATNKQKYGPDFYQRIGAKGGAHRHPNKGFGSNRELARVAGFKGGIKSRRTKTR